MWLQQQQESRHRNTHPPIYISAVQARARIEWEMEDRKAKLDDNTNDEVQRLKE